MTKFFSKKVWLDIKKNMIFSERPTGVLREDILCFDSQLEYRCYQILRRFYHANSIECQHSFQIKPRSPLSSSIVYVADFLVTTPKGILCVESKGLMTPAASLKLKILEITLPCVRSNLVIVSEKPRYYFGKGYPPSLSLTQFESFLQLKERK